MPRRPAGGEFRDAASSPGTGGGAPGFAAVARSRRGPRPPGYPPGMAPRTPPVVTFTTDFGDSDAYVASMKGVVLSRLPAARLVDVTHAIEPGDLPGAALVVQEASRWFPPRTVHVVVVDPGVGTDRRALAIRTAAGTFVGPDNGVLAPAAAADPRARVRALEHPSLRLRPVSATFHGRDVFAPAAAALAGGFPFHRTGPVVTDPVPLEGFEARRSRGALEGAVLRVDRFGNLITSVRERDLELAFDGVPLPTLDVRVDGRAVDEVATTYGRARPGVPFVLLGSGGRLEIALRDGSAAAALGAGRGAPVRIVRRGGGR